jgi:hypothetical protein
MKMGKQNESNQKKQLSLEDPVDPGTMAQLSRIHQSQAQIAERLARMELEKVRLMRAFSGMDTEQQKIFDDLLISRGLPPNLPVEITAGTGKIKLRGDAEQFLQQQQASAAPGNSGSSS